MKNEKNIHLVGNAHLDPVWMWRWPEGQSEVLQTFRSALDRLAEYPKFVFTCSSAAYYKWVEKNDSRMFNEIRNAVRKGRWIPVGGMWVQPDCNMPSAESFARQALYSQLYYKEKFGKKCKTAYNVDSFGHSAMMPQLLKKSGMAQYVMMRPNENENPDIPKGAFWWESPDGTRILVFRIPTGYGEHGRATIDRGLKSIKELAQSQNCGAMMFYGVGNHGGGPTKGDIEYLEKLAEKDSDSAIIFSDPDKYFDEILNSMVDLPVWKGEMQHHASGCYSAMSKVKAENRKAENMLYSAEVFDTLASAKFKTQTSTKELALAWEKVCFNQFHDILCGCSVREAYEDVFDFYGYAKTIAKEAETSAIHRFAASIDTWVDGVSDAVSPYLRHESAPRDFLRPVVVFNPLSFDVTVPVRVSQPSERVYDFEHTPVVFSNVRSSRSNDSHKDTVFIANIPAFGYSTYWLGGTDDGGVKAKSGVKAGRSYMENEFIRVEFDKSSGGISKLVNKKSGEDYCEGRILAVPVVVRDEKSDTWAHNIFKFDDIIGSMSCVGTELIEKGGARAVIRVKYTYGKSYISCDYILAEKAETLRVKCRALWQEKFTMVKIPFDIGGTNPRAVYEIQSGFIERPALGDEEPAQKWADITSVSESGSERGLSIINDSRYSYDCTGTRLSLTVIRNVIFADHYSDRPPADFDYTDEGLLRFEYGIYLHDGGAAKSDVVRQALKFNIRTTVVKAGYHKGSEPVRAGFIKIDADNVVVTALKYSEDKKGSIILRLYETKGESKAKIAIMSKLLGFAFYSEIGAHEIKTFRIDTDGRVSEVNFLE